MDLYAVFFYYFFTYKEKIRFFKKSALRAVKTSQNAPKNPHFGRPKVFDFCLQIFVRLINTICARSAIFLGSGAPKIKNTVRILYFYDPGSNDCRFSPSLPNFFHVNIIIQQTSSMYIKFPPCICKFPPCITHFRISRTRRKLTFSLYNMQGKKHCSVVHCASQNSCFGPNNQNVSKSLVHVGNRF